MGRMVHNVIVRIKGERGGEERRGKALTSASLPNHKCVKNIDI